MKIRPLFIILLLYTFSQSSFAQVPVRSDSIPSISLQRFEDEKRQPYDEQQDYDLVDGIRSIFPKKSKKDSVASKRSGLVYLPNLNYNPSIGAQLGLKVVGGIHLADRSHTTMSTFATALSYTTRGIIIGYFNHDVYTSHNAWNFKGMFTMARMVGLDYGLGIGKSLENPTLDQQILNNPERHRYTYHYNVFNFNERVYKRLAPGMFVGGGVFFELKRNISVTNTESVSPNDIYSIWNGFDARNYNNNGLMANFQYMTRDNPNNAYHGSYADIVVRANQTWMGSRNNAYQVVADVRHFWDLSTQQNGKHVLGVWGLGSFNLGKESLPYLDLPGTGKDAYARSGRGYTFGYFKGISFFYSEVEYRFPILPNRFLRGVVFANVQTANDQMGTNLFQYWQPAAGTGLRLLFNKTTRTNLCIDYAVGRFGQRGLFLGLNEAF